MLDQITSSWLRGKVQLVSPIAGGLHRIALIDNQGDITMTADPNEVVKVYSGSLVVVEAYKQALADAGIESKMAGDSLLASFGTAVPGAVELYVHQRDLEKAVAAIERYEKERVDTVEESERPAPGRPANDPKPDGTQHRVKHHIPPHPTGQ
jgi:hypothetical protein